MASDNIYSYEPLSGGQFRLLQLSVYEGELVASLHPCSVSAPWPFTALSYAWNSPGRDEIMAVGDKFLKITKSVQEALLYLAQHVETKYLWIDGVCIDQENLGEKNMQVPLMAEIYTRATEVIIWLGESNELIDKAIDVTPKLNSKLERFNERLESELLDHALAEAGLPTGQSPIWDGFTELYSRSWFSRLWTFQEAVLPSNVKIMCGHKLLSFDSLSSLTGLLLSTTVSRFVSRDQKSSSAVAVGYSKVMSIAMYRKAVEPYKTQLRNMSILLSQARQWSVSKPVDRLYGMLGLSDEEVIVDYNLSPAAVYSAYARRHLMSDTDLSLLHAASSNLTMGDLPSWCPNFNGPAEASILGGVGKEYRSGLDERTMTTYRITSDEKANTISVMGFRVDVVDKVVPSSWEKSLSPGNPPKPIRSHDFDWEEACLKLSQTVYHESEGVPRAHWQTLIADKDTKYERYQKNGKRFYALMKITIAYSAGNKDYMESHPEDVDDLRALSDTDNLDLQDYFEAMRIACRKRQFFSTGNGRIGLGPLGTLPGDMICIFYNGYTPFIIRPHPQPNDSELYRFIGEAYVDGIMYGEALKAEDRPKDRVFVLH